MPNVTPYHLDRIIDSILKLPSNSWMANHGMTRFTQSKNDNAYTIIAPLVGVTKNDLSVNVVGNNLVVSATPSVQSRWSADFRQTWILNEDADVDNINAKLENGLLTLTVPRLKPTARAGNDAYFIAYFSKPVVSSGAAVFAIISALIS